MPLPELSPTELAVLELLAEGDRTSEIAKRLSLEYRTVAATIGILKSKLMPQSQGEIRELAEYYKSMTNPQKD